MTRTLTLAAFVFSLVALPAWNSARACGGYGSFEPQPDLVLEHIEGVVRTHFASHRQQVRLLDVERLSAVERSERDPAEHAVRVRFMRGEQLFVQVLRVDNTSGSWRVVGGERPLRAQA